MTNRTTWWGRAMRWAFASRSQRIEHTSTDVVTDENGTQHIIDAPTYHVPVPSRAAAFWQVAWPVAFAAALAIGGHRLDSWVFGQNNTTEECCSCEQ